jgi:hypothetical protein
MPRVVPSIIVAMIDRTFSGLNGGAYLDSHHSPMVAAIVGLIEQLPEATLARLGPEDNALFLAAVEASKDAVHGWKSGAHPGLQVKLRGTPLTEGRHPMQVIRDTLNICPDEAIEAFIPAFPFLADAELELNLRQDLSSATAALGKWRVQRCFSAGGLDRGGPAAMGRPTSGPSRSGLGNSVGQRGRRVYPTPGPHPMGARRADSCRRASQPHPPRRCRGSSAGPGLSEPDPPRSRDSPEGTSDQGHGHPVPRGGAPPDRAPIACRAAPGSSVDVQTPPVTPNSCLP